MKMEQENLTRALYALHVSKLSYVMISIKHLHFLY